MDFKAILRTFLKIILPLAFGCLLLWYLYSKMDIGEFSCAFHFLCSFFHHNFELEWWLSAYQEDTSSSFRRLQWLYNRVAAPKISARPPAV